MYRTARKVYATLCLALVSVGCASTPLYSEVQAQLPAPAPGHGRLFLFTPGRNFALSFHPTILVNGEAAGRSNAGSFLVIDRPAGEYTIEADKQASFASFSGQLQSVPTSVRLTAGEPTYVEIEVENMGFAVRVAATSLDPTNAQKAIRHLRYDGGDVPLP
jgi:hypothetical protein